MRWTAHISDGLAEALDGVTEGFDDKTRGDLLEDLLDLGHVAEVRELWQRQKEHAARLKAEASRTK